MGIFWLFFFLILICIYVLFGLYLTDGINDFKTLAMTWVIYTCLWITIGTVFLLAYFWGTLRKKTGPYGVRGVSGERGEQGMEGTCNVSATQSEAIRQVSEMLDELYKAKSGKSMLNLETQSMTNKYLTNKISTVAGSKQYKVMYTQASALNKTPQEIINYVKGIWKEWFNLIYTANPEWFLDEYADEDYSWPDNSNQNPFTEIKKYDMYYWGLSRSFRPMRAEVCRSSAGYESSKFPLKPQARLKIIQSNDYMKITDDWRTRGKPDASWWRARTITIGDETYYPVNDIITAGARQTVWNNLRRTGSNITGDMQYDNGQIGPDMRSILVAGDVVDPIDLEQRRIGGGNNIMTASPICPEGYVSMGDIINYQTDGGNDDPAKYKIKCVPADCVEDNGRANQAARVWRQRMTTKVLNHWDWGNPDANGDNGYNAFRWSGKPFYRIKPQCLAPPAEPSTKEPEDENIALGIGWYGHPYKSDPRYSIFTFLGLVPEGMIVHQATGRRFYIIHYGGEDVNKYIVLDYNQERDKFDSALQVDDARANPRVYTRDISRKDERQQWQIILQSDKKILTLKNIMNARYLYMGLEPNTGNAQFSTIKLDNGAYRTEYPFSQLTDDEIRQNTTFSFISTFGTQMNILDNDSTSTTSTSAS
jgi:hypothetical protein